MNLEKMSVRSWRCGGWLNKKLAHTHLGMRERECGHDRYLISMAIITLRLKDAGSPLISLQGNGDINLAMANGRGWRMSLKNRTTSSQLP